MIHITLYAWFPSPSLHLKNSGWQFCKPEVERRRCHGRKRRGFRKRGEHMPSRYPFEVKTDPLSPFLAQHLIKMEFVTSTASWDYIQGQGGGRSLRSTSLCSASIDLGLASVKQLKPPVIGAGSCLPHCPTSYFKTHCLARRPWSASSNLLPNKMEKSHSGTSRYALNSTSIV